MNVQVVMLFRMLRCTDSLSMSSSCYTMVGSKLEQHVASFAVGDSTVACVGLLLVGMGISHPQLPTHAWAGVMRMHAGIDCDFADAFGLVCARCERATCVWIPERLHTSARVRVGALSSHAYRQYKPQRLTHYSSEHTPPTTKQMIL